jgi:putative DNA primase/helicase
MSQIEQLKNILPAIPSLVDLKTESQGSLCGPCPKCGGVDRFVFRTDSERFWCRQCHEKPGDVVDFHGWLKGVTTKDLLEQYFPKDNGQSITAQWQSILSQYTNKDPVYRLLTNQRKISETVIDKAFTEEKIRFFKHRGKESVACAYTSLNGNKNVLTVQYLTVDGSEFPLAEGKNKVFAKGSKAKEDCFFQAGESIEKAETIILCEAVINALSSADCIPEACILAIGGTPLTKKVEVLKQYKDAGKRIICFFDNDSAGMKATQRVAKILGVKTESVEWPGNAPSGFDINNLLMRGDRAAIVEMVENATPVKVKKQAAPDKQTKPILIDGPLYNLTDQGNAERLILLHGNEIRFCHPFKRWYIWAGKGWDFDKTGLLKRFCKDVVKKLLAEAIKAPDADARKKLVDFSQSCETNQRMLGMLSMAESEPGIPILPEDLDKNQYLFNCKNGTINLKTGELRPHNPEDLITKMSPYNYDPEAKCPKWLAHLDLVMGGNQELIDFLQKAYGYCLTGDTSERKFFVCYGSGANGKSITSDVVALALGDYANRTPTETLLVKRGDPGVPNDVARLKGARFVYASENEAGQQLAESKIKDITGGERIAARFMRGDWFEFYPEFKIWLGTNHRPVIKGTDNAIWDRIRLIPFTVRISEDQQRPKTELMQDFIEEMPGILAWMVQGCLKWQSEGLGQPSEVMNATNEYRSEMDILAVFLEDCCVIGPTNQVIKKNLYDEYEKWTEDNGERKISKKMFGIRLKEKGFDSYSGTGNVQNWIGIGIK